MRMVLVALLLITPVRAGVPARLLVDRPAPQVLACTSERARPHVYADRTPALRYLGSCHDD